MAQRSTTLDRHPTCPFTDRLPAYKTPQLGHLLRSCGVRTGEGSPWSRHVWASQLELSDMDDGELLVVRYWVPSWPLPPFLKTVCFYAPGLC
jgi:hypothetical protein